MIALQLEELGLLRACLCWKKEHRHFRFQVLSSAEVISIIFTVKKKKKSHHETTVQLPHKVPDKHHKRSIQNEGKLQYLLITSGLTFPAALVFLILLIAGNHGNPDTNRKASGRRDDIIPLVCRRCSAAQMDGHDVGLQQELDHLKHADRRGQSSEHSHQCRQRPQLPTVLVGGQPLVSDGSLGVQLLTPPRSSSDQAGSLVLLLGTADPPVRWRSAPVTDDRFDEAVVESIDGHRRPTESRQTPTCKDIHMFKHSGYFSLNMQGFDKRHLVANVSS